MIIGVRPGRILHIFFPLVLWFSGYLALLRNLLLWLCHPNGIVSPRLLGKEY